MHEVILSVGIDIGTSTTQLIFSRLTIENRASSYTVPGKFSSDRTIQEYVDDIWHLDKVVLPKRVEKQKAK